MLTERFAAWLFALNGDERLNQRTQSGSSPTWRETRRWRHREMINSELTVQEIADGIAGHIPRITSATKTLRHSQRRIDYGAKRALFLR